MVGNWSVKRQLVFWSAGTVMLVTALTVLAHLASSGESASRHHMSEQWLSGETSRRDLSAQVLALAQRQQRMLDARTVPALKQLPDRDAIELQFEQNWRRLSALLTPPHDKAGPLDSLHEYYRHFLTLDDELLTLKQQSLQLEDRTGDQLADSARQVGGLLTELEHIRLDADPHIALLVTRVRAALTHILALNYQAATLSDDEGLQQWRNERLLPQLALLQHTLTELQARAEADDGIQTVAGRLQTHLAGLRDDGGLYALYAQQLLTRALLEQTRDSAQAVLSVIMTRAGDVAANLDQHFYLQSGDAQAAVEATRWRFVMLYGAMLIAVLAFSLLLFRSIERPLTALRTAMRELSEGRFDTRLPLTGSRNEIALLARDFNLFADNTERLINQLGEAKQSLEAGRQHTRAILNGVPEAILSLSADGTIDDLNPAAERVLNTQAGRLRGRNLLDFMEDSQRFDSIESLAEMAGDGAEFDGVNFSGQPQSVWMSMSRLARHDSVMWVCVISDIGAWKKVERQLRQTTTELDAILENAMVGIAFIRDRRYVRVNQKFEQLLGYSREEIEGRSTLLMYPNEQAFEHFGDQAYAVMNEGQSYEAQVELVRRDGSPFWCAMSGKAIDAADPLQGSIWLFEDVTRQRENEERLTRLASIDTLTGLPNRTVFNDRLEHAIHKAHRNAGRLAVFFLDLDHFKHINDSLGHKAGDALLSEVAERIKSCVREGDTVARLGGDEFTLILEDVRSAEYVGKVAEKVLEAMSRPYDIDGTEVSISPSIGISLYPADGRDVDLLIRNADAAMYHAKNNGRNNFQFYSVEMNAEAAHRLAMETALRRAVEHREFYLHYQPQIDLDSGTLAGAEVLLRWHSVQWGEVSPAVFVPMLEDIGLIATVGEWVLRHACETYLALRSHLPPTFKMAVNLSGRQFRGGRLASDIRRLLQETGMPAANLELEITESTLMDDTELAVATLRELSAIGISLAIDDFGTGYSSLSYLKQFPLNALKIDGTFVRDVTSDQDDAAIVQAILAMSYSLQLSVTAEGVETAEQLDFLRAHDCHMAQGYYLSRPLDRAAFIDYLERQGEQQSWSARGRAEPNAAPD